MIENPFTAAETAALYARGRPDHHPRTVRRLARLLPRSPVDHALDVACGTGSSTSALHAVARRVVGMDVVPSMVATAVGTRDAAFVVGAAEHLPFPRRRFGLVAIASAVHWFDQPAFFAEAARVLDADGVVAVTEHFFVGEMDGSDRFGTWIRRSYAVRYPTPARGRHLSATKEVPAGFEVVGEDAWPDPIPLTQTQLVDYLLTQSNTVAVVDAGRETRAEVRQWLISELAPFYAGGGERTLQFWGGAICYRPDPA